MKTSYTAEERHVYAERLALLGVIDRPPTEEEAEFARNDVERFRAERAPAA